MSLVLKCAGALALLLPIAQADTLDGSTWDVTIETSALGPVSTRLSFQRTAGVLHARSASGALHVIQRLLAGRQAPARLDNAVFALSLQPTQSGYAGRVLQPFGGGSVQLNAEGGALVGAIEGGIFAGSVSGKRSLSQASVRDYPSVWSAMQSTIEANIFDIEALQHPDYVRFARFMAETSETAIDDVDFLVAFRAGWNNAAFSHFELRRSNVSAEEMLRGLDDLRVGGEAARVEIDGDIALLTVDTMMGNDTIEQIEAAYQAIAKAKPEALVIDLRNNGGGAFAVKPLVEHVIDEPLNAGYFIGRKWSARGAPSVADLAAIAPWTSWSISAFWRTVQQDGLVKLRFTPAQPNFDGEVYVLLSHRSASATELAADALRSSRAATLIGETTAGEMLSQRMFDVGEGFILSLPIADYVSIEHGRIEGVGVPAAIEADADEALATARRLHAQSGR